MAYQSFLFLVCFFEEWEDQVSVYILSDYRERSTHPYP